VADNRQFGSPKVSQFGDRTSPGGASGDCAQCEAMLADALDGTLSAADQAVFDLHMGHCGSCSQMLADARRGAAWLEMLRDPRPEPPAELLERILAQTSGVHGFTNQTSVVHSGIHEVPGVELAPAPVYGAAAPSGPAQYGPAYGKVIPFRSRFSSAVRASAFGQIVLQPRLAMTAAMAFFSIALTMDLTGVRLQDIHASDLRPSSLQRDFYFAKARGVRYYEGLRVVYELESRVHDLQSATSDDTPAGAQTTPQDSSPTPSQTSPSQNGGSPNNNQPGQAPAGPANHSPSVPPERKQLPPATRHNPNPGTSRREDLNQQLRVVASARADEDLSNTTYGRERAQA
jgi:hypothetical protein